MLALSRTTVKMMMRQKKNERLCYRTHGDVDSLSTLLGEGKDVKQPSWFNNNFYVRGFGFCQGEKIFVSRQDVNSGFASFRRTMMFQLVYFPLTSFAQILVIPCENGASIDHKPPSCITFIAVDKIYRR